MLIFFTTTAKRDKVQGDRHSLSQTDRLLPFQVNVNTDSIDIYLVSDTARTLITPTLERYELSSGSFTHAYNSVDLLTPIAEGLYCLEVEAGAVTLYSEYFYATDFEIEQSDIDPRRLPLPLVFNDFLFGRDHAYILFPENTVPKFDHRINIIPKWDPDLYLVDSLGGESLLTTPVSVHVEMSRKIINTGVSYWKLNDAAGLSATDEIGGKTGTLSNDAGWDVDGVEGGSASFLRASESRITHGEVSFADREAYEFSCFLKWDGAAPVDFVIPFGQLTSTNRSIYLADASGRPYFNYRVTSNRTIVAFTVMPDIYDGEWHKLVWMVDDNRKVCVYVDDIFIGERELIDSSAFIYSGIGKGHSTAGYTWNGLIDEVFISQGGYPVYHARYSCQGGTDLIPDGENYRFKILDGSLEYFSQVFKAIDVDPLPPIIYGYLYNWWVTQEQISSDAAWGVPTDAQYTALTDYLIATYGAITALNVANYLKSCRQINSPLGGVCDTSVHPRWNENVIYGIDEFDFGMFGGGYRSNSDGSFALIGTGGYLWSGTSTNGNGYYRPFSVASGVINRFNQDKKFGCSLRLVRNATAGEIAIKTDGTPCEVYTGNDGKTYRTVYINEKVYTAEHLAETLYRDGAPITKVTDAVAWAALATPAYCAYNNDENYV